MDWLLPLLLLDQLGDAPGSLFGEQLLPAVIPGPAATRVAFAALNAEQQARSQAFAGRNIVRETILAARIAGVEELKSRCPEVFRVFQSLPADLQKDIIFTPMD
jgi:hypothetical protein